MKMAFESYAIICIIAAFVVAFVRTKKYEYAISVWPLALVPFAYIISPPMSAWISQIWGGSVLNIRIVGIMAALVICSVVMVLFAGWIANKKQRIIFMAMGLTFNLALACIYVFDLIQ